MSIYHEILGIAENASLEEIKNSYRKLCKKYHPDISSEENIRKISFINEAYSALVKGSKEDRKTAINPKLKSQKELDLYKDQAYAFYRKGYSLYQETLDMDRNELYGIFHTSEKLNQFERKTLEALYYLNIVCVEYEDSQWSEGSIEIIKAINRNRKFVSNVRKYRNNKY